MHAPALLPGCPSGYVLYGQLRQLGAVTKVIQLGAVQGFPGGQVWNGSSSVPFFKKRGPPGLLAGTESTSYWYRQFTKSVEYASEMPSVAPPEPAHCLGLTTGAPQLDRLAAEQFCAGAPVHR